MESNLFNSIAVRGYFFICKIIECEKENQYAFEMMCTVKKEKTIAKGHLPP